MVAPSGHARQSKRGAEPGSNDFQSALAWLLGWVVACFAGSLPIVGWFTLAPVEADLSTSLWARLWVFKITYFFALYLAWLPALVWALAGWIAARFFGVRGLAFSALLGLLVTAVFLATPWFSNALWTGHPPMLLLVAGCGALGGFAGFGAVLGVTRSADKSKG